MATLPANSTFLPVLDDLLSPDFRPSLTAQTPQTPADAKNLTFTSFKPVLKKPTSSTKKTHFEETEPDVAAKKIQTWWKRSAATPKFKNRSNSVDITAERAKHSIRHNRTEDHVRYLEAEVNRLKSALTNERKLRSLQLEAIRSLWTQMQTLSNGNSDSSIMTQSMPNGLAMNGSGKDQNTQPNLMSQSMVCTSSTEKNHCSCATEINSLKDTLTSEISQVRTMIEELKLKAEKTGDEETNKSVEFEDDEKPCSSASSSSSCQKKRPVTLNLGPKGVKQTPKSKEVKEESVAQKPVSGYANKMAAKLVGDVVEKEGDKK